MAQKLSAGILLYRISRDRVVQVLIAHMGGPFWERKDKGGWSIPKGEYEDGEDPFQVALREFEEELGKPVPAKEFLSLGSIKQPSGKVVTVWAAQGEFDEETATSNTFVMEWPKGSGQMQEFPEVDRVGWFDIETARTKLLKGHVPFLERLVDKVREEMPDLRDRDRTLGALF